MLRTLRSAVCAAVCVCCVWLLTARRGLQPSLAPAVALGPAVARGSAIAQSQVVSDAQIEVLSERSFIPLSAQRTASGIGPVPVLDDSGCDLLKPKVQGAGGLEDLFVDMNFFRLSDDWNFIDPMWPDETVLEILQRVVDIWWREARIMLRVCPAEALRRVRLPRANAAAYVAYVEYPKRDAALTVNVRPSKRAEWLEGGYPAIAAARRKRIEQELGPTLTRMLIEDSNLIPDGLLRFVRCWPMCFTPWAVFNTMPVFPSYFYYHMNGGGGKRQSTTLRSAACNTWPRKSLWGEDALCLRFASASSPYQPSGVVRSWEKNATRLMSSRRAGRLIAHEIGHNFELVHRPLKAGERCKKYDAYEDGELMGQVRAIGTKRDGCGGKAPDGAADAVRLPPHQAKFARAYLQTRFDLRQTPAVSGAKTVGQSTEQFRVKCRSAEAQGVRAVLFHRLPVPAEGRVLRARWCHIGAPPPITDGNQTQILLFVARRTENHIGTGRCGSFRIVATELVPYTAERAALERLQPMVHTEVDLDLNVGPGDVLGLAVVGSSSKATLGLAHRALSSDQIVAGDIMAHHFSKHASLKQGSEDVEVAAVSITPSAGRKVRHSAAASALHKALFAGDVSLRWLRTLRGWWEKESQRKHVSQIEPQEVIPEVFSDPFCTISDPLAIAAGVVVESVAFKDGQDQCSAAIFNFDLAYRH